MVAKHSSKILNLFFILIIIFITIITANILNQNDQENKYSLTEATVGIPSNLNPIIQNHNQSEDDIIALAFNGLFKLDNEGKPIVDLADAFPILLLIEIIITGLLNLSFILEATIPITPSCQFFPLTIITGSEELRFIFYFIFSNTTLNEN